MMDFLFFSGPKMVRFHDFHQKSMENEGLQWVFFRPEKNKKPIIDEKIFFHINMYLTENSLFKVFASV